MSKPSDRDVPSPFAAEPGVVYLVGAGPGDPGLLTVRGLELLRTADVVLHDELVHLALLDHVRPDAAVRCVGKRGSNPPAKNSAQSAIDAELVSLAQSGKSVVRLKGGDPFLFGRGSEEAETLARNGLRFEIVPGIPSPLGAAAYSGISLTHRDLASSVTFVSGTTRAGERFDWSELAGVAGTICVLMGMRRLEEVTEAMIATAKRDPSTPVAIIQWGTRAEQAVVTGPLDQIAARARDAGLGSPAVIVIGAVTELRRTLRWFDARPLFGKRVLVMRAREQASVTSNLVRRRGGEPIECPTIAIGDPPDPDRVRRAILELSRYDAVLFTSENGVSRFFRALDDAGLDVRAFGRSRVGAVGTGTAAALAARGLRADVVPREFHGEALAEAVLADPVIADRLARGEPTRALLLRALVAREVLPETLRARGVEVDIVPVYETHPASTERRAELTERLEARAIDVVLLTSSSTADNLCDMLGPRAAELLQDVLVASIGPITTKTAERRGLTVGVAAETSTLPGLLAAVERALAPRTSP